MNAEIIIAALLNHASITALVGNRRALLQLPQNTSYPALVYNIVDGVPQPNVAYQHGAQRAFVRFQINPLAQTVAEIKAIHTAIRNVLDFKHQQTVAGKLVVSCRFDNMQPMEKDLDANIWTQSADYILTYYE
jgi:3-hydroxymyristoyl/3-hydroxydecanoyl-(acyl carrier protein) dehydratase